MGSIPVKPLSVLDLSPITEGGNASLALHNSRDLAQHAERLGYNRYWLAEHHNMPGIASAATAVVIGHVAAGTTTIRVGSGGIMLPNHAPLMVAEQFGTLEALFPGRIDLGVGRAPGTDQVTAHALRRNLTTDADNFPQDVAELLAYLGPVREGQRVRAVPGAGSNVPVWILGSSLFGAQLAAILGLPYAFASHFAPEMMMQAVQIYRERFRPSEYLQEPYVMLGFNVFAAETEEEAELLSTSMLQSFLRLRFGNPGPLPPPLEDFRNRVGPMERAMVERRLECSAIGTGETVRRVIIEFLERTGADELMITSQIYDHAARVRSYRITAEAYGLVPPPQPA